MQPQKIIDVVDASRGEDNAALFCNRVALALLLDAEPVARCDCAHVLFSFALNRWADQLEQPESKS